MSETIDHNQPNALPPPERRRRISARAMGIGGAIAVLIAGAALGAGGTRLAQNWEPQRVMLLQPAAIVSEGHLVVTKFLKRAIERHDPDAFDEVADQTPREMCVAENSASDGARRSGP